MDKHFTDVIVRREEETQFYDVSPPENNYS
jgi:hypothetical protein